MRTMISGVLISLLCLGVAPAGKDGKFYREAFALLRGIEGSAERIPNDGQPKGVECWRELSNQPGCHPWDPDYLPYRNVTWNGDCSRNMAQGRGTLKWMSDLDAKPQIKRRAHEKDRNKQVESFYRKGVFVRSPRDAALDDLFANSPCAKRLSQSNGESTLLWQLLPFLRRAFAKEVRHAACL